VPKGQYTRLTNVINNQDGSLQATAGTALAMTAIAGAPVVHSLRRASDFVFGSTKAIVGAGTAIYWFDLTYPGGGSAPNTITLQADSTALQIDVVAAAGTYTRGAGSFLTNGFRPGMVFNATGFTNAGNNGYKMIATVTALVITIVDITGLVNETGSGDERLQTIFSGNPISITPAKLAFNSVTYAYIGDTTQNVKINNSGAPSRMGIPAPGQTTTAAQGNAPTPAAAGAGNLNGDYDWRYTFYNTNTGQEGNPSATMAAQDSYTNEAVNVTVTITDALTDAQITHVRLYRRGGTLTDNWRRVSTTAIGAGPTTQVIADDNTDTSIVSAPLLELDNDVPVVSVNSAGATRYLQPIPYIWGPVNETLFACGDAERASNKGRPDAVYWSKRNRPESWPLANFVLLGNPVDKTMNGFVYNGKSYVFTREQLYMMFPQDDGTWLPLLTPLSKGIVGQWAFCVGGGYIWFCAKDGVYRATDSESEKISDPIRPLFPYRSLAGYASPGPYNPVNFGAANADVLDIRMAYHNDEIWFIYRDSTGPNFGRMAIYSAETKAWRFEESTPLFQAPYSDEIPQSQLLLLGRDGTIHHKSGNDWNGTVIDVIVETGGLDQGAPRDEKEYGDVAIWADPKTGKDITVGAYANGSTTAFATDTITGNGLTHKVMDLGGNYARFITLRFSWQSDDSSQPRILNAEVSYLPRSEDIIARETDWDDLGQPSPKWITGVVIEADPMGTAVTFQVQSEGGTVRATLTTPADVTNFPREYSFTFAGFAASYVRILPTSATKWKLYRIKRWVWTPMPEASQRYDTDETNHGFSGFHFERDAYIELISNGTLTLTITVDGTALAAQTIASTGGAHRKLYIPFPPNKGKVYKYAITLGAATAFQLYDLRIRAKQWNGESYQEVRPLFRGATA